LRASPFCRQANARGKEFDARPAPDLTLIPNQPEGAVLLFGGSQPLHSKKYEQFNLFFASKPDKYRWSMLSVKTVAEFFELLESYDGLNFNPHETEESHKNHHSGKGPNLEVGRYSH
jgi:hypothetical protein